MASSVIHGFVVSYSDKAVFHFLENLYFTPYNLN